MIVPIDQQSELGPEQPHLAWRAFLFEPEVLQRFEPRLGGGTYLDAFEEKNLTNPDIARTLAVISSLSGEWSPGESVLRSSRLEVCDRYVLFPIRREPLRVVIVLHPVIGE